MKPAMFGVRSASDFKGDRTLVATREKLSSSLRIMLPLFGLLWPCRGMDTTTANAREALFREVAEGHVPNAERLAALARALGITMQAVLLDLLVEAKGIA